jgi:cytochrome c-type biogenesis protein CcmH/NrfG
MYRATGDEKRAFTCFTRAYKLNPRNIDAMREIRLANMRRRNEQGAPEPEGFFARLFGARG